MNKTTSVAEEAALKAVREWLKDQTGLHFPNEKKKSLELRLTQFAQSYRIQSMAELYQHIRHDDVKGLIPALIDIATTNHTFFYREETIISAFKKVVLPTLKSSDTIRLWSAACSTGEEAYTFLIVMCEKLGLKAALDQTLFLGTDISQNAVSKAEEGTYSYNAIKPLPEHKIEKYFDTLDNQKWQVKKALRDHCMFRRLNLNSDRWPFNHKFNVIFCRNVFYYFDVEQQSHIASQLYRHSVDQGWLITSVTESIRDFNDEWTFVQPGLYRKVE